MVSRIQYRSRLVVENRAVDVIANGMLKGNQAAGNPTRVHKATADYIRGQAQVTALFTKVILSTTETSATTNALNYPLDAAERLMNAAGQRAY